MTTIRCPSCEKLNRVGTPSRGTPRCGSCKVPLPWVVSAGDREFEQEYAGRLKLIKVNVDEAPRTAQRFEARSIPTLTLLRDGRELDRAVGALPEARLDAWLSQHIDREAA